MIDNNPPEETPQHPFKAIVAQILKNKIEGIEEDDHEGCACPVCKEKLARSTALSLLHKHTKLFGIPEEPAKVVAAAFAMSDELLRVIDQRVTEVNEKQKAFLEEKEKKK